VQVPVGLAMEIFEEELNNSECDVWEPKHSQLEESTRDLELCVRSTQYYFDDDPSDDNDVIIGVMLTDFEDGVVTQIDEDPTPKEVLKMLKQMDSRLGNYSVHTYVRMISNDNF
jgi:hypothetical protein